MIVEPSKNGEVLESAEEVTAFATWCTAGNHWGRFHELFQCEDKYSHVVGGVVGRRPVTVDEFVEYCHKFGFTGDAVEVFRLIQKECLNRREMKLHEEWPDLYNG